MHKTPKLIILRGATGSGKSTLAVRGLPGFVCVSADDYFTDALGAYKFDGTKIQKAHDVCYQKVKRLLEEGKNVVVDNTNIRLSELTRYFGLRATYRIYHVTGNYKSTKNVPDYVGVRQRLNYEPHKSDESVETKIKADGSFAWRFVLQRVPDIPAPLAANTAPSKAVNSGPEHDICTEPVVKS